MSGLNPDEIITQKHKRNFIQFGGAQPGNPVQYAGQDAQYMFLDGVSAPESGGVDPVFVPDPRKAGRYKLVARSITAPDLPNATLLMLEKHGSLPRQLQRIGCAFNLYELSGQCKDLSDFLAGWSDYVLIYSGAEVTDKDLGTRTARDSDDPIEDSLSVTLADIYPVGALGFGQEAATQIDKEVIDIVYGTDISCNCTDNTNYIYGVTKSSGTGSPGLPSELIYTVDGGGVWQQANIDGIGATEEALAIDIVGNYLVTLGLDSYYIAEINSKTGVPGTFTKVTTGFVAAGSPNDMYVASPREVWFAGDGGYIYKSTDITAGVVAVNPGDTTTQNLTRIHGREETIVAVGAAGTVVKSNTRGATWIVTTAAPSAAALSAIAVIGLDGYWVGTATGYAYFTKDGGETWTSKAFSGSGAGAVKDIVFCTEEVGFMAHNTAAPVGRLFCTWNGGENWTNTAPRVLNFPVIDYVGRIANPNAHSSIAANNVALACLAGDGIDGTIALGIASRL
jgi:hypothetical protein